MVSQAHLMSSVWPIRITALIHEPELDTEAADSSDECLDIPGVQVDICHSLPRLFVLQGCEGQECQGLRK